MLSLKNVGDLLILIFHTSMIILEFDVAGPKGRSYVLMLLRMNKLVVENVDGSVSYRVL